MKKIAPIGFMTLIFATFVIVGSIVSFIFDRPSPRELHLAAAQAYIVQHDFDDEYWMDETPNQQSVAVTKVLYENLDSLSGIVAAALRSGDQISPLAGGISRQFTSVAPSIDNLGERFLARSGDLERINADEHTLHICFVPRDRIGEETRKIYFSNSRRAIMIPAIRWPAALAGGLIVHEAGHAFRFSERGLTSLAIRRTPLWATEEVEMHELQTRLMDRDTGGKYQRWIDAVVVRTPRPEVFEEALYAVRSEDLAELDSIFDSEDSGRLVAGVLLTHSMLAVGFRSIDLYGDGGAQTKAAFYLNNTGGGL